MPMAATFRSRLVARELLYGAWSVIPSPLSVRLLAAAGLDYVVIDLQHGGATETDLPGLTSAIRLAGAAPVARVRHAHTAGSRGATFTVGHARHAARTVLVRTRRRGGRTTAGTARVP